MEGALQHPHRRIDFEDHMVEHIKANALDRLDGIAHGFFGRRGGISNGIYESLNIGLGSRDDLPNVRENRSRIAATLGVAPDRLLTPYQIHGTDVVVAETPWAPGPYAPRADAVVTKVAGLAVGISTADCTPILFADANARVIGATHAGWRGALAGALEATVARMEELDADRGNIIACIGPTISQPNYEVGSDFRDNFLQGDPQSEGYFTKGPNGRPHFDLPGYVRARLERAGISQIELRTACTYSNELGYFSYRRATHRAEPDYGRQISAIVLTG